MNAPPSQMPFYVLDTDTLSRYRLGNANIAARLLSISPQQLSISVITVEEPLNGWYKELRKPQTDERLAAVYERIARTVEALSKFRVLSFDTAAISLYRSLEAQRLNVGKMDLRIGAISQVHGAIVVTSNGRDFERIPGVVWEDWA